jgi:hypothetical protein
MYPDSLVGHGKTYHIFVLDKEKEGCFNVRLIDWLIYYLRFYVPLKNFSLRDVTIAGEGLQNLGLCSALRALEQGGIFIVRHLQWHGTSVFPVSSEGPPHLVAFYDTRGDMEDQF